jgi:CHU_C Type IX secretion signal domain
MKSIIFSTAIFMCNICNAQDTISAIVGHMVTINLHVQKYNQVGAPLGASYEESILSVGKGLEYTAGSEGDEIIFKNGAIRTDTAYFTAKKAGVWLVERIFEYENHTEFGTATVIPYKLWRNRDYSGVDSIYIRVRDKPVIPQDTIKTKPVKDCRSGIFIPNAFNPESMNVDNQIFRPFGVDFKDYSMNIYNRWGDMVCESKEWDGMFKGQPQSGSFVYIIQLKESGQVCRGVVTILYNSSISGR